MTHPHQFVVSGEEFTPIPRSSSVSFVLPPNTYSIKQIPMRPAYLAKMANMSTPSKIYGETKKWADRIYGYFKNNDCNVGVLLEGERGSGKTLLSKVISDIAAKDNIPTILVNDPSVVEIFGEFLQQIPPSIIILDEFEKIFDKHEQQRMLTVLDGVLSSRHLFILAVNNVWSIDENLINRPGRIRYKITYRGLTESQIVDFCNDRLEDKSYIDKIVAMSTMFKSFNFDMLRSLVDEMNIYKESPEEAIKLLNIDPSSSEIGYTYKVFFNNVEIPRDGVVFYGFEEDKNPMDMDPNSTKITIYNSVKCYIDDNGSVTFMRDTMDDDDVEFNIKQKATSTAFKEMRLSEILTKRIQNLSIDDIFYPEQLVHKNHTKGEYKFVSKAYPQISVVCSRKPRITTFSYFGY